MGALENFARIIAEINDIEEEMRVDRTMSRREREFWKSHIKDLKDRAPYDFYDSEGGEY